MSAALPSRLLVGKREPQRRRPVATAAKVGRAAGAPHTFVDSMPVSVCVLEATTDALRAHCAATFGRTGLDGRQWAGGTPAHAALLGARVPWRFLARDGAASVVDTSGRFDNPLVQVGASPDHQVHALASVSAEATSQWARDARRVDMGARQEGDPTPAKSHAPAAFPAQRAVLFDAQPLVWAVPPAYEGAVSRVCARLEDARAPTRFWVVAPAASAALDPASAAWSDFCARLVAAAVVAEPLDGFDAVLVPAVAGQTVTSPLPAVAGLAHPFRPSEPPAEVVEASMYAFLKLDEAGADDREDGGDGEPGRGLAFAPGADLLVAVCDTLVPRPLLTFVVCNEDLRAAQFADRGDALVPWEEVRDGREWVNWTVDM